MFQIGVIVFREIVEIALIISILTAATKGINNRSKFILLGVTLGVLGSIIVALFTSSISELFNGTGQDIFNAAILLLSSAMISWTVIWMKKHAAAITANIKQLGQSVLAGNKSLFALLPIVTFSVLREGAEIVLFSYSSFISGTNIASLAMGALIGLMLGIMVGFGFYYGLLKIFGKYFFTITSWMLIFLAAGMASQAMSYLASGGFVPEIIYPLWDSSFIIAENSPIGKILHIVLGYVAKPSGIQVLSYSLTLLFIFTYLHIINNTPILAERRSLDLKANTPN